MATRKKSNRHQNRLFAEIIDGFMDTFEPVAGEAQNPNEESQDSAFKDQDDFAFNDENVEDFDTNIMDDVGNTHFPIIDGFWIQGDFLAFLTLDVIKNDIYIECFQFINKAIKSKFRQKLCPRKKYDSWTCVVDENRRLLSFIMYEYVSSNLR